MMAGHIEAQWLEDHAQGHEFFNSLWEQYQRKGDLSPKQWACVERAMENEAKPVKPSKETPINGDLKTVRWMLERAQDNIKFPAIRMHCGDFHFKLYMAGPTSKWRGWIQIKSKGGDWIGRVNPEDGTVHGKIGSGVWKKLNELAANPVQVAKEYGLELGSCCFCGRTLTHDDSLKVGYGPICADRYGLPHGGSGYAN